MCKQGEDIVMRLLITRKEKHLGDSGYKKKIMPKHEKD